MLDSSADLNRPERKGNLLTSRVRGPLSHNRSLLQFLSALVYVVKKIQRGKGRHFIPQRR